MSKEEQPPGAQRVLLLSDDTRLYRAIRSNKEFTKDGRPNEQAFRLRPLETGLSVALDLDKALNELDYKGYTTILAGQVRELGLTVRPKEDVDDLALYEIVGIPLDDEDGQLDRAFGLAKLATPAVKMRPPKK